MTDVVELDSDGVLTVPATLKIKGLLPGPIEGIWAYLTESDLRRQWLASGEMDKSRSCRVLVNTVLLKCDASLEAI